MSQNLSALVAALETINQKDLELSVVETEKIFKKGVVTHVLQQNALVASIRQVAVKDVLKFTDRYIASKLNTEDPRDIFFNAAREVTSFVEYAVNGPALDRVMTVEHRDLLPAAHPFSTKTISPITASARRVRNAAWVAWDPRITDDAARKAVFDAYVQQPNSTKGMYAVARLEAITASVVPADIKLGALTAAFGIGNPFAGNNSSIARSARAKLQRRDRKGRFAEMGGGSRISVMIGDMIRSFTGKYAGNPEDTNRVEVELAGDQDLPGGIYSVPTSKVEGLKAILRTGAPSPDVRANSRNSRTAIDLQELLASRKTAPTGWEDNGDGTFTSADGYTVSTLPAGTQAPAGSNFIGAGSNGVYDANRSVFELKDDQGNSVGFAQEWANLQKLAADSDESKGAAPRTKARLRTPQPAGFRQEAGTGKNISKKGNDLDTVDGIIAEYGPAYKEVTNDTDRSNGERKFEYEGETGMAFITINKDGTVDLSAGGGDNSAPYEQTFTPDYYGEGEEGRSGAIDDAFGTADVQTSVGEPPERDYDDERYVQGFEQAPGDDFPKNDSKAEVDKKTPGWLEKYSATETTTDEDKAAGARRWSVGLYDVVRDDNPDNPDQYRYDVNRRDTGTGRKDDVADARLYDVTTGKSRKIRDDEAAFAYAHNESKSMANKPGEKLQTDKQASNKENQEFQKSIQDSILGADIEEMTKLLNNPRAERFHDTLKAQIKKAEDYENGLSQNSHYTDEELSRIQKIAEENGFKDPADPRSTEVFPNDSGVFTLIQGDDSGYSWSEMNIYPDGSSDLTNYYTAATYSATWDSPADADIQPSFSKSLPRGSSLDDIEKLAENAESSYDGPEPDTYDGFEQAPGLPGFRQRPGEGEDFKLSDDFFKDSNWSSEPFKDRTWTSEDGRIKVAYVQDGDAGQDPDDSPVDASYLEISVDGEKLETTIPAPNAVRYEGGRSGIPDEVMELDDYAGDVEALIDNHLKSKGGFKQEAGKTPYELAEQYDAEVQKADIDFVNPGTNDYFKSEDGRFELAEQEDFWSVKYDGQELGPVSRFDEDDDGNERLADNDLLGDRVFDALTDHLRKDETVADVIKDTRIDGQRQIDRIKAVGKRPFETDEQFATAVKKAEDALNNFLSALTEGDAKKVENFRLTDFGYRGDTPAGRALGILQNIAYESQKRFRRASTRDEGGFAQSAGSAGGVDKSHLGNTKNWSGDPSDGGEGTYTSPDGRLSLEAMVDADTDGEGGMKDLSRIAVSYDGEDIGTLPKLGVMYNEADLADDVDKLVSKHLEKQTGGFNQQPGSGGSSRRRGNFVMMSASDGLFAGIADTEDGGTVRLERDKGMITAISYNRNGEIMGQSEPTDSVDKAVED